VQEYDSAEYYRPEFEDRQKPFTGDAQNAW
jgi:hypothetical protein